MQTSDDVAGNMVAETQYETWLQRAVWDLGLTAKEDVAEFRQSHPFLAFLDQLAGGESVPGPESLSETLL